MKIDSSLPKGTRDYAPNEMELVQFVLDKVKETYVLNGFNQVKTPILANLSLLTNGDSGDNSKMMFKTIKRGAKLNLNKEDLQEMDIVEEGLRYDLTVPIARFYAQNLNDLPKPFKVFQIGESFRAEKPQKARDREFTQCDIDIFGDGSNLAEIEIIISAMQVYSKLGFKNVKFKINDRKIINQLILNAGFSEIEIPQVMIEIDKYDKIGYDGIQKEMLALNFDPEKIFNLLNALNEIRQKGLDSCINYGIKQNDIDNLKEIIKIVNEFKPETFSLEFDVSIIRGQGYYTGTVFEAFYLDASFTRAIGGGGRYDNMLEKYVGQPIPAVGYSVGLVGCVIILREKNIKSYKEKKKVCIIYGKESDKKDIILKKNVLMKEYTTCIMPEPKNFKSFMVKMQDLGYDGIFRMKDGKLIWFE